MVGHRLSMPRHRSVHMGTASKSSGREILDSLVRQTRVGTDAEASRAAPSSVWWVAATLSNSTADWKLYWTSKGYTRLGAQSTAGSTARVWLPLPSRRGPSLPDVGGGLGNCQSNAWKLDASCDFFLTVSVGFSFVSIQFPLRRPIGVFLPGQSSRSCSPWLPP